MRVFVADSPDEKGKLGAIAAVFKYMWQGRVLDVGSRGGRLRRELPPALAYYGLDIIPPADVLANLESGLPFQPRSFDAVVALDVLEHTNNIHRAIAQLCRVSHHYVVISLPNVYEIVSRVRFALGKPISGKYGLPAEPLADRHRLVLSWLEAREFTSTLGLSHGFQVVDEGCLLGPRRGRLPGRLLVQWAPNVFSPWYVGLLERTAN